MGRPIIEAETQLIKNGPFYNDSYWAPVPPWVIENGKAKWKSNNATAADDLFQQIYAGANETYLCHFRAEILVGARAFNFKIGDVQKNFPGAFGLMNETFELTPTINGNLTVDVGLTGPMGSEFHIWNISVIGTPVGDPMYDMLFTDGFRPHRTALTEYDDLGGGEEMFRIASRADSSNCLIKVE